MDLKMWREVPVRVGGGVYLVLDRCDEDANQFDVLQPVDSVEEHQTLVAFIVCVCNQSLELEVEDEVF